MLPSCQCCQGPGGSSELGEWKVEAHGNVLHPTSRDTRCVPFRSLSQVSPRVLKARSGFEVNLTELYFFHEVSMAFAWNQRAPKQMCTYLHMCDKLQRRSQKLWTPPWRSRSPSPPTTPSGAPRALGAFKAAAKAAPVASVTRPKSQVLSYGTRCILNSSCWSIRKKNKLIQRINLQLKW